MTKSKKIVYYVLKVLISALFIFAAIPKLMADPMAVAGFTAAGLPLWFVYLIGISEVVGVIGLWIPFLRNWAALGLSVVLIGAITLTAIFVSIPMAILPLVALIVLGVVVRMGKVSVGF